MSGRTSGKSTGKAPKGRAGKKPAEAGLDTKADVRAGAVDEAASAKPRKDEKSKVGKVKAQKDKTEKAQSRKTRDDEAKPAKGKAAKVKAAKEKDSEPKAGKATAATKAGAGEDVKADGGKASKGKPEKAKAKAKPVDSKPVDSKPAGSKPSKAKATQSKSPTSEPAEVRSEKAKSGKAKSGKDKPGKVAAAEPESSEPESSESKSSKSKSAKVKSPKAEPGGDEAAPAPREDVAAEEIIASVPVDEEAFAQDAGAGDIDFSDDDFDQDEDFDEDDLGEEGEEAPAGPPRCGFVALLGAPNAGKSTLTNALVGTKVSIVSHKVQTTRSIVRGIAIDGAAQIILVDTPGIFAPKRRLERAMVTTAWSSAADADLVALLIDAKRGLDEENEAILTSLAEVRHKRALIINKIDLVKRDSLLALVAQITEKLPFDQVFLISATTGDGVSDVLDWFAKVVPEGPWLYPEDQISDAPMRMLAAEITREKMFLRLHDELPYRSTVETESWKELRDGSVRIEQTIFVERESQRKIVLGRGGAAIKAISSEARAEIAEIIETPVHLFLFVKVRDSWADDPERYRAMGLEFPKGE